MKTATCAQCCRTELLIPASWPISPLYSSHSVAPPPHSLAQLRNPTISVVSLSSYSSSFFGGVKGMFQVSRSLKSNKKIKDYISHTIFLFPTMQWVFLSITNLCSEHVCNEHLIFLIYKHIVCSDVNCWCCRSFKSQQDVLLLCWCHARIFNHQLRLLLCDSNGPLWELCRLLNYQISNQQK